MPFLKCGLITNFESAPSTTTAGTCLVRRGRPPNFTDSPLLPFILNFVDMHHQPRQVHAVMLSWRIAARHSSTKSNEIPVRNMLISSLLFDTTEVEYLENFTNFREYSIRIIEPYLRLMNSSTLASLKSMGKNLSKKVVLNNSHVIGPSPNALLSCHILHQAYATSFNLYEAIPFSQSPWPTFPPESFGPPPRTPQDPLES